MRNVLVIAYYFPPLGMGGVQRTLKFCKYLPEFGWNPIVVTVKDVAYYAHDSTLPEGIPVEIYRTESLDPLRLRWILGKRNMENSTKKWRNLLSWFLIPDNKSPWLPFMFRTAKALIQDREISLIFCTSPPVTSLVAGYLLKKHSNRPLVIDLRDPFDYGLFPPTTLHSAVIELLKKKITALTDGIITAHPFSQSRMIGNRITVIPNGFDPSDFAELPKPQNKFLIVHTGTLTKKRNALPFLRSLKELIESSQISTNVVRVRLVGWVDPYYAATMEEEGLSEIVELLPYTSHKESVNHLMSSSVLWLPAAKGEIPGKIYEYIGSNKPIIATAPEGDCAELIRTTRSGVVIDPSDRINIKKAIVDHYRLFLQDKLESQLHRGIDRYSRINQTRTLASIFDEITE